MLPTTIKKLKDAKQILLNATTNKTLKVKRIQVDNYGTYNYAVNNRIPLVLGSIWHKGWLVTDTVNTVIIGDEKPLEQANVIITPIEHNVATVFQAFGVKFVLSGVKPNIKAVDFDVNKLINGYYFK